MGVTLRYCDLCGNKLGPEELESPQTLKVKDKIFCGDCRPKVMAALQKQKAAKAETESEADAAPAAAPKRKAPAKKKLTRRAAPAAEGAAAAPKKRAPSKAPARPAPSRAKPAESTPVAKSAAGKVAAKGAAPKRPVGKGPAARKKVASKKPPAMAGKGRGRPTPPPAELDTFEEGDPQPFAIQRKSNVPMIVGIIVVVVGLGVGAVFMLPGSSPKPNETANNTKILEDANAKAEEAKQAKEKEAKKAFEDAVAVAEKHPEHYRINIDNFRSVMGFYRGTESGQLAANEVERLTNEWREKSRSHVDSLNQKISEIAAAKDFDEAFSLSESVFQACDEVPPVLDSSDFITEFRNVRKDAHLQFIAMQRLKELRVKAFNRLKQGEQDIALSLLEQLPEKYEDEVPNVWMIRDRELEQIKKTGVKVFLEKMEAEAAEFARLAKEALEKERAEREQRWNDEVTKIRWVNQLNPEGSLYNWVVDSDARRFGQPPQWSYVGGVLSANNNFGQDMYRGLFTNTWQDYLLRMEVRIGKGELRISPRSQYRVDAGTFTAQTSPSVELSDIGSGWVSVTMMVRADTVIVYKGKEAKGEVLFEQTYESGLPSAGGFAFFVGDDCEVDFRKVETKLVNKGKRRTGA